MFKYKVIGIYTLDGKQVKKLLGEFQSSEQLEVCEAVGTIMDSIAVMQKPDSILLNADNVFALSGDIEGHVFTEPLFKDIEFEVHLLNHNKQSPKVNILSTQADYITEYYIQDFADTNYLGYEQIIQISKSPLTEIPIEVSVGDSKDFEFITDLRIGCAI